MNPPGLRSVTVEDLIGSDEVQFPVALLKHVDAGQPAGRGDQSLLHGCRVHQLPVEDGAGGQRRAGRISFISVNLVLDSTAFKSEQCCKERWMGWSLCGSGACCQHGWYDV